MRFCAGRRVNAGRSGRIEADQGWAGAKRGEAERSGTGQGWVGWAKQGRMLAGRCGAGRCLMSRGAEGLGGAGRGWNVAAQGKTERDEANRRGTENQETVRVVLDLSDWCVVGRGWADRGLVGAGRARASGVGWGGT